MTLQLGKDINKTCIPVIFNELLSFLQRVAEYMKYAKLLKQASQEQSPISRLQQEIEIRFLIFLFYSRIFIILNSENNFLILFRIICEQVSHHLSVSAFYDSEDFIFHGSIHPKLKFWGISLEVHPKGIGTVEIFK
ncbi:oxysterol-binding protein 2 [Lasius niger]|uniref:Oxysterol-binding protein 2 n=1 Tax=Lasius niger TaxID=67767 RepID=A0A0J7JX29_LASNI|nr:oxysterol-binding protein 2 [Lasius niger]